MESKWALLSLHQGWGADVKAVLLYFFTFLHTGSYSMAGSAAIKPCFFVQCPFQMDMFLRKFTSLP